MATKSLHRGRFASCFERRLPEGIHRLRHQLNCSPASMIPAVCDRICLRYVIRFRSTMVSCQEEVPSCPYGAQTMLESCYNIGAVVIRIGLMVYYTIITMCHLSCCGFGLSFAFGRLILHVQRVLEFQCWLWKLCWC